LQFDGTIEYRTVSRNDNYRIYDVDSDKFIEKNKENLEKWLKKVKENLEKNNNLKPTDNIIIVAPCHESNSKYISLINKIVFSSSATIIYNQKNVDYKENFSLMNKNYLSGEDKKVFFVDDSLITGSTFFELYDLIQKAVPDKPLTASILLNDQAEPFVHNRVVLLSNNYFSFSTYNQPPALNVLSTNPLEYEHARYKSLQESTLHDALKEHFYVKTRKLDSKKPNLPKDETPEKQIRRLKMFVATHKIYDYYATTKNAVFPNLKK
jgi:hypoxanthine phosphoribosyltransferase